MQFQVSPVASTQLERACYVVAFERWGHQEQVAPEVKPMEDPELQMLLLSAFAGRLLGEKRPEEVKNGWVEAISMNDSLTEAFEELTERVMGKKEAYDELLGMLQAQLLESVELRTRLQDAAVEVGASLIFIDLLERF